MSKVGKRSNPGKDLLEFVIGMVMLSVGLFWLSNVINVNIGLFGGGMMMGDFNVSSGAIFVPFIVAVIWIFIKPNIWAKIFLALSIILIITAIIMSAHIGFASMKLWEWLILLVLMFGGAGLVAKQIFLGGKTYKYTEENISNKYK